MANPVSIPTAEQCQEALGSVDEIWESVPRGHRAVRKGAYDSIRRILNRVIRHHEAPVAQAEEDEEGEGFSQFEAAMMIIRELDREQCEQIKILIDLRRFSDEGRLEIFDEMDQSHCLDCGAESRDPEDHDCPAASEDAGVGEEEGEESHPAPTPRRREPPAAPADEGEDETEG